MVLCLIRNINMETPYKIDRMPNQLHYTYLDTFGRPVLVATKNNLVEQHIQDVVVRQEIKKKRRCNSFVIQSSLFVLWDLNFAKLYFEYKTLLI